MKLRLPGSLYEEPMAQKTMLKVAPQSIAPAPNPTPITEDPDPKKQKVTKVAVAKKPFDWNGELKAGYNKKLNYDNLPVGEVVKQAAKEGKIDPSELLTSAWVEGLNEAAINPNNVSEAYNNAAAGMLAENKKRNIPQSQQQKIDTKQFPVDGFYNYGLDTIGQNYSQLKKYLPEGFDKRLQFYDAYNESGDKIKTAAFKSHKDALIAKAAFMNMEKENAANYAKKKYGVDLDNKAKTYFTMAAFNGGPLAAQKMIDEYVKAKDKNKFIDEGQTTYLDGRVHKNISPRMKMLATAQQLLNAPSPSPAPMPNSFPINSLLNVQ